jgi:electron transfer flavoprotein alpha subunit
MTLVYLEIVDGKIKKSSFEAVNYAHRLGDEVTAIAIGAADDAVLAEAGKHGAKHVIHVKQPEFENNLYAGIIAKAAMEIGAKNIIISNTYTGKAIAPRIAIKMDASIISGVIDVPQNKEFKKGVFSGQAFAFVNSSPGKNIITLTPNTFSLEIVGENATIESKTYDLTSAIPATRSIEKRKAGGKIPLTEAEVVVSAGRGMKGPENWGMVEQLADLLGAATACSKPVSDMGWRPHTEHVGQTGITIKPNLYLAIGISGAIQHLAGVSSSKVIVAINKDPEAPFFKVADYGIVGDAFEVLPRIIEAAKVLKGHS